PAPAHRLRRLARDAARPGERAATRQRLRSPALPARGFRDAGRAAGRTHGARGLAFPGAAHHAHGGNGDLREWTLPRPHLVDRRRRRGAVRGEDRGVRQPAVRYIARHSAVSGMASSDELWVTRYG